MSVNTITLDEFKDIFNYLLDNNKRLVDEGKSPTAIGLIGEAGLGKTSVMQQIADERGMTFVKLNLSELEETSDLTGFPIKEYKIKVLNKDTQEFEPKWVAHDLLDLYLRSACEEFELTDDVRMSYATPAWLPREENENGVLLLLDDYSRANSLFMQATMELINTGRYISWKLPKYTTIALEKF